MNERAYERVTDLILEGLEAGVPPWTRPWAGGLPRSLATGREYQGVNVLSLAVRAQERGFASPWWATWSQIQRAEGRVRRGEKGTPVIFWKIVNRREVDQHGRPMLDDRGDPVLRQVPFAKPYTVWNLEQTTLEEPEAPEGAAEVPTAEAVVEALQAGGLKLRHNGPRAYYSPRDDEVTMPPRQRFHGTEEYYRVLFHELSHWTGHPTRLGRFDLEQRLPPFGSWEYGEEELVAEVGAGMVLARLGLEWKWEASTAYIQGWLRALDNDRRMVTVCAGRAQKAANWLISGGPEEPQRSETAGKPSEASA